MMVPSPVVMVELAPTGGFLQIDERVHELKASTGLLDGFSSTQKPPPATGRTALHTAILSGSREQMMETLRECPPVNVPDSRGCTPMMMAAAFDAPELIACLAKSWHDVNSTALPRQETPLHIAAALGRLDAVEALLFFGADPQATTTDGLSALDLARHTGNTGCAAMICSALGTPLPARVTAAQLQLPDQAALSDMTPCNYSWLGERYGCVGGEIHLVGGFEFSGTQTKFVMPMDPSTACGNWTRSLLCCIGVGTVTGCFCPLLCLTVGSAISCCQCGREVSGVVVEQHGAKATITWKRDVVPPNCAAAHTLEDEVDFVEQQIFVSPDNRSREQGGMFVHFKKKLRLAVSHRAQFSHIRLAAMLGVPARFEHVVLKDD